ncbi:hypothetical protein RU86_GL000253 [Lactococcus piscium]|uniref:Uncharacterized protein n=1 Tax=Pseudolactococcus piscium TaxID=1364 RepID=A0A2A5RZG4_9LACT|nr:hypothetical protein RU86_GL000253 [Lactococcus piscium]
MLFLKKLNKQTAIEKKRGNYFLRFFCAVNKQWEITKMRLIIGIKSSKKQYDY